MLKFLKGKTPSNESLSSAEDKNVASWVSGGHTQSDMHGQVEAETSVAPFKTQENVAALSIQEEVKLIQEEVKLIQEEVKLSANDN